MKMMYFDSEDVEFGGVLLRCRRLCIGIDSDSDCDSDSDRMGGGHLKVCVRPGASLVRSYLDGGGDDNDSGQRTTKSGKTECKNICTVNGYRSNVTVAQLAY